VHHGNGTQDIFWRDPRVLYASMHQWPLYPGTGHASETGEGPGLGTTLNVPITEPWGDEEYLHAMRDTILPALRDFGPDFLLISAGYDIDGRDPLGGMDATPAGFSALTGLLRDTATELCGGRLAVVLEGGYHLDALREGVAATLAALASPSPEDER
ncbi:MAG: histone deacetylase, partial [Gemmatimonadetes bacterium]|nr:histone deacetylase [Gemmatimonadota bacterium]